MSDIVIACPHCKALNKLPKKDTITQIIKPKKEPIKQPIITIEKKDYRPILAILIDDVTTFRQIKKIKNDYKFKKACKELYR